MGSRFDDHMKGDFSRQGQACEEGGDGNGGEGMDERIGRRAEER